MKLTVTGLTLAAIVMTLAAPVATAQNRLEGKARSIHFGAYTVDSHNDTPMSFGDRGFNITERHDINKDGSRVDFPRMREGGLDGAFFAVFTGQGPLTDEGRQNAYERARKTFDLIHDVAGTYPEQTAVALTPKDAVNLEKSGRIAMFIGVENGYPIGLDINRVKEFYNLGARYITLCHSRNNDICDSSTDQKGPLHNGLSPFGKQVVNEMNHLGIMIDVSHMSDKSFYDVLEASKVPVVASHSCCRALCNHPRNLTDDMIRSLGEHGGVLQMCVLSGYVIEPDPNPARDSAENALRTKYGDWSKLTPDMQKAARAEYQEVRKKYPEKLGTVSDLVNHIDHVVRIAGIDHVGIGTDFDGGGGLADCMDVSQMGNITLELVRRGYSKKDIEKIWSGNIFRVMNEVSGYAAELKK